MQQPNQYGERDYVFANAVVTKRLTIGLTQQGLATLLGVSSRAVENWEQGITTPKMEHLRHLIALCIEHQAFSVGEEVQEARALWQAARCKALFDERWLRALLEQVETARNQAP